MSKGMLGNPETLRQFFSGPFADLAVKLNGERGEQYAEWLNKLLRDEMMPIPVALPSAGIRIVKTSVVVSGGGRTTDQIVKVAKELPEGQRPGYINPAITQANIPSGNGRRRTVLVEWFGFDHDPTTEEVRVRCEEPGYGYSQYEDGLRFQEDHPDNQRTHPHVVIPENPWCDAHGNPRALYLWGSTGARLLSLYYCCLDCSWSRYCLFARRKYLVLGA